MIVTKLGRNSCGVYVGTSEGKSPLRIPRRSWEDNIKMDVTEIGWGGMDWIHLNMDRDQRQALANMVITNKSSGSIKHWEILEQLSACWLLTKDSME
jgi:hypothetical protein